MVRWIVLLAACALMPELAGCGVVNTMPMPCPSDAAAIQRPDGWMPDVPCDGDRPDIAEAGVLVGASDLVISADGTMYYTQPFAVGRWQHDMPPEDRWASFPNGTRLAGLTLDPNAHRLYVGSPSDHAIYSIDLTAATPTPSVFVPDAGSPNGLTLSSCGDVFYTDLSLGNVWWADRSGRSAQVNTMGPIAQPAGLAFGPDLALYVTSVGEGAVKRLVLVANVEQSRTTVLSSTSMSTNADAGVGAPHGIAFDALGRIYLTDALRRYLMRFNGDGTHGTVVVQGLTLGGGMDFGAGPLNCADLYVTNSGGIARYTGGNMPGADVPWHH